MTTNIDTIARTLCEERWGKGAWESPKINRSYWRRQAKALINSLVEDHKQAIA